MQQVSDGAWRQPAILLGGPEVPAHGAGAVTTKFREFTEQKMALRDCGLGFRGGSVAMELLQQVEAVMKTIVIIFKLPELNVSLGKRQLSWTLTSTVENTYARYGSGVE